MKGKNNYIFLLLILIGFFGVSSSYASCTNVTQATGGWTLAQNNPIGPPAGSIKIYPQRFQPAGTVLFDQTYPMSTILGGNPEAVLYKCTKENDAINANAILRLDDTFAIYGTYMHNSIPYYYINYYGVASSNYGTIAYKMSAVMHDGSERDLMFSDVRYNNTGVTFLKSGYEASELSDKAKYPWVVKAKHYPAVRLMMIRTSYDTNRSISYLDGLYGRVAYDEPTTNYNYDATYGYIKIYNHIATPGSACGITQVPRTVNLGTYSKSDISAGLTTWIPFTVTYQCNNADSPVTSLRIGMQPQNASNLLSNDYRYLKPDAGGVDGVGIVYRRQGQTAYRNWIQNSGCVGISTDTENNSNCPVSGGQGENEGWYTVNPEGSSGSATPDYTDYYETFEASIQPLPGGGSVTTGTVTSTVNVLVSQP